MQTWQKQIEKIAERQKARDQELRLLPELEKQLAMLHNINDLSITSTLKIQELTTQVQGLRELQQYKWRLWSRMRYLKQGDAPTSYFLRRFKRRQARNKVRGLQLESGEAIEDPQYIVEAFASSFQSLYTNPSLADKNIADMTVLINTLQPKLLPAEQAMLGSCPSLLELTDTLHMLPHDKAPGLDAFTAESLKIIWPFYQQSCLQFINYFRAHKTLPVHFLQGAITLIPKLVHEKLVNSKKGAAFDKIDLAKAYDRLSSRNLWLVLQQVGCGRTFTQLVQGPMVGAQVTAYMQGYASAPFSLDSGVRKGCPLAPLLFALASVPLVNLFNQAVLNQTLTPALLVNGAPVITTLYADDVSLFLPWDESDFA
ncbi:hypothetical protein R1sor_010848 [Riccia sorocarpa]|uniref:Reverse transcriptase domain-containing protein n=1 Tax=Riccia sorocarpa TaxID=122646 RepID=A0ABD3I1Y3_9MARC